MPIICRNLKLLLLFVAISSLLLSSCSGSDKRQASVSIPAKPTVVAKTAPEMAAKPSDPSHFVWHRNINPAAPHTWKHSQSVYAVAFSPDGRQVLTGSLDNTAVLRDVASGKTRHTWKHSSDVNTVAFSPDGRQVLTGSWDNTRGAARCGKQRNTAHLAA